MPSLSQPRRVPSLDLGGFIQQLQRLPRLGDATRRGTSGAGFCLTSCYFMSAVVPLATAGATTCECSKPADCWMSTFHGSHLAHPTTGSSHSYKTGPD